MEQCGGCGAGKVGIRRVCTRRGGDQEGVERERWVSGGCVPGEVGIRRVWIVEGVERERWVSGGCVPGEVWIGEVFFGGHTCSFWGHWYPCFGFLVTSPLGFKARVGSALFPEIHLWCYTC